MEVRSSRQPFSPHPRVCAFPSPALSDPGGGRPFRGDGIKRKAWKSSAVREQSQASPGLEAGEGEGEGEGEGC